MFFKRFNVAKHNINQALNYFINKRESLELEVTGTTLTWLPSSIYGSAGHGKGLIDDMSSFSVKYPRHIVVFDQRFTDSKEMRQ